MTDKYKELIARLVALDNNQESAPRQAADSIEHLAATCEELIDMNKKQEVMLRQADRRVDRIIDKLSALETDYDLLKEQKNKAIEVCRIIDDVVKEGHDNLGKMVMHFLTAAEPARLALHKFNARQAASGEAEAAQ